jgi:hypothetical protein
LEQQLDAIEIAFLTIKDFPFSDTYRRVYNVELSFDDAVRQANRRFRQQDVGYQLADGVIIESDSEYTYAEIVEPAIDFLQYEGFEQARDEFLRAHQHYRHGEMQDALIDANNALESTLRVVLERRGVVLTGKETATNLTDRVTDGILPAHLRGSLRALRSVMGTVPELRNRPGVGHGAGSRDAAVLDAVAELALNYTAATIKFSIESVTPIEP